ncbi:unnamed protein product [Orchesella dallaii]|uniref:Uncharacterized protein n=1 Tax=Orchesella dallaii TaxID=48710 RepID=A0ABP1QT12_9HEXA
MEFLNLSSALALIVIFQSLSCAIKLDPNVGSNWYPTTTITPTTRYSTSASALLRSTTSDQLHYNNGELQSSSSFYQTAPVSWGGLRTKSIPENYYKYYYQANQPLLVSSSETPLDQYQYYHHQQESNEHSGASGPEQRLAFSDPSTLTNLLPGSYQPGIGYPIDAAADPIDDESEGSIFDNIPFLGSLGSITSGIGSALTDTASAVGLGGLGFLGPFIVAVIGAPLLVLFILFPVAVLVLAILGFPVLTLTLPASGVFLGRKLQTGLVDTARQARDVLQSEECVERLSCIIAKKSRKLPHENWILE